jgi:DNA topoisomerase VI subunit B
MRTGLTVNELCRELAEYQNLTDRMRMDRDNAKDRLAQCLTTMRSTCAIIHWTRKEHGKFSERVEKEITRTLKEAIERGI